MGRCWQTWTPNITLTYVNKGFQCYIVLAPAILTSNDVFPVLHCISPCCTDLMTCFQCCIVLAPAILPSNDVFPVLHCIGPCFTDEQWRVSNVALYWHLQYWPAVACFQCCIVLAPAILTSNDVFPVLHSIDPCRIICLHYILSLYCCIILLHYIVALYCCIITLLYYIVAATVRCSIYTVRVDSLLLPKIGKHFVIFISLLKIVNRSEKRPSTG